MEPTAQPSSGGDSSQKKQLLQRLISGVLQGPSRSIQEVIGGIKNALSTYKNFAKEWDNLSSPMQGNTMPVNKPVSQPMPMPQMPAGMPPRPPANGMIDQYRPASGGQPASFPTPSSGAGVGF